VFVKNHTFDVSYRVATRQAMYMLHNFETHPCNQCCGGKSNKCYMVWVCVCSLSYTACNAHEPYCHLWPAPLYSTFRVISL